MDMFSSTHSIGDIYEGAAPSTGERANPAGQPGTAMGDFLERGGASVSGMVGLPLPTLIALGALAFLLLRFYGD